MLIGRSVLFVKQRKSVQYCTALLMQSQLRDENGNNLKNDCKIIETRCTCNGVLVRAFVQGTKLLEDQSSRLAATPLHPVGSCFIVR